MANSRKPRSNNPAEPRARPKFSARSSPRGQERSMKILRSIRFSPLAAAFSCALAAALPLGMVASPAYSQNAAGGDLDRAVAALRGISTMRADFTQTDRQGQTAGGVMTLKRPGKIRF